MEEDWSPYQTGQKLRILSVSQQDMISDMEFGMAEYA